MMKIVKRVHYGWVIVIGVFFCAMGLGASRYLYSYVLPTMEVELNLPHEPMGNIASAHFLAYAVMAAVFGIVVDRIGPRKCMSIGLVTLSIGLAGMGSMSSLVVGLISYLICGAGAAALYVSMVPLISAWFGGKRRGTALGITLAGTGILIVAVGLVVPNALVTYSWRWVWWSGSALVLIIAAISWFLLLDSPAEKGLAAIGANGEKQLPSREKVAGQAAGQKKAKVTIKDIMKRGAVWNLAAVWFGYGGAYVIFITFAVAYLQEKGWGIGAAAGSFATFGVLNIPGPLIWGIIADRFTKKYLLVIALILQGLGIFLLWTGATVGGYLGAALVGFGNIAMPVLLGSAAAEYFETEIIGTTIGFIVLFFGISSVVAPTLGGILADSTGTLSPAILLSLGGYAVASILMLMLKKPPKRS
ncbi:nitrate/nitrite transporter [Chloroflexota bacterium]